MGEGHITSSKFIGHPQYAKTGLDGMAALHTNEAGYFLFLNRMFDVCVQIETKRELIC